MARQCEVYGNKRMKKKIKLFFLINPNSERSRETYVDLSMFMRK